MKRLCERKIFSKKFKKNLAFFALKKINKTHLDFNYFENKKNLSKNKVSPEVKDPVYSLK
ncbi:hypothetical protein BA768_09260 [Chryseobacterium sp. CBo1]|nr:hypothetical protein BA768_09260 [Chryseobacterium sp. CBo1]